MQADQGLQRTLLRAALREEPPADLSARTLSALGLGAAITASTTAASGAAAAVGSKAAAGLGVTGAVKWVGIGVFAGAVALGAVQATQHMAQSHTQARVPAAQVSQRASEAVAGAGQTTPAETPGAPATSLTIQAQNPAPAAPGANGAAAPTFEQDYPAPPPLPADSQVSASMTALSSQPPAPVEAASARANGSLALAAEVALLDKARAALAGGRADEAISILDSHSWQFPAGALGPEAFVVRLQAMTRAGQGAAARQMARELLQRDPGNAQRARILAVVGEQAAP